MPHSRMTRWAVLGLVARHPRSGSDIARLLTHGFGATVFRRASSEAFEEPRRLVARGWAEVEQVGGRGRRSRRVYSITAEGRDELAAWLSEPSAPPVFESEALLKVFFADLGGVAVAHRAIDDIERFACERLAKGLEVTAAYSGGDGTHQDSERWVRLTARANLELTDALLRWVRWAREDIAHPRPGMSDLFDDVAGRLEAHLGASGDQSQAPHSG